MLGKRFDADKVVRTSLSTLSAGTAECRVDLCNAVDDLYSVMLADLSTVSETYTSVFAHSVTAVKALYSFAGLYTGEYE